MSRKITMTQALNEALRIAMQRDENVLILGEDVAAGAGVDHLQDEEAWGGAFRVTEGLANEFGRRRVIDTPISEGGYMGAAMAAAVMGLRPVPELMFLDFISTSFDQVLNQGAKFRYMFGGKAQVPVTVRAAHGAGYSAAAQHSQALYGILTSIPGVKVVVPSNPADAKGLLLASIEDNDPVFFCEDKVLYNKTGEVPEGYYTIPLGKADIKRQGTDVTIVAIGKHVNTALQAAEKLEKKGIDVEVVDPRTLSPLDEDTILASVEKTGRAIVVDEGNPRCGIAVDIAAMIADKGFDYLDAPIKRITPPHTPVPFSSALEKLYVPSPQNVIDVVSELLGETVEV